MWNKKGDKMKRVLKGWIETVLILVSCVNSIIAVGGVEADNYLIVCSGLICNLIILLVICKYGRGE